MAPLSKPKPKALPPSLLAFVHEYDSNGGNGTAAWRATHPAIRSVNAAAVNAARALRNAQVAETLRELRADRFRRLAMTGDEALARVSAIANVDVARAMDEAGRFLPFKLWPASVRRSVKSFKLGKNGVPYEVKFYDALIAQRIILEQTGKLENPLKGLSELARLLSPDEAGPE